MSPLNTVDLHRIFLKLDKNSDGVLSLEELNWLLERIGVCISLEELELSVGKSNLKFDELLSFYDRIANHDEDGRGDQEREMVDEEEEHAQGKMEEDLAKAFKVFDSNGDGFISCEDLQGVLSRLGLWDENSGKDCRSMICVFDTNLDGVLNFEEFKNMMLHTSS